MQIRIDFKSRNTKPLKKIGYKKEKKIRMLPARIELATLGLWDLRAANCATGAIIVKFVRDLFVVTLCQKNKPKRIPTEGLEPSTTRLRVLRSTNWARRDATVKIDENIMLEF